MMYCQSFRIWTWNTRCPPKKCALLLLLQVVSHTFFWDTLYFFMFIKGHLTSNQSHLQRSWFDVTQPSIQKGEFLTTVGWVVFFPTPPGPNNTNKLAKLIVLPSALICTDKHWCQWSAMMTMMGNEGNDVIEDIDVLCTYHILLPYPLPQSQCFALALYYNEEVKNI